MLSHSSNRLLALVFLAFFLEPICYATQIKEPPPQGGGFLADREEDTWRNDAVQRLISRSISTEDDHSESKDQVFIEFKPLENEVSPEVRDLQVQYETLKEIFNELGVLVQNQDEQVLQLVIENCRASVKNALDGLYEIDLIQLKRVGKPWFGLSVGTAATLSGIILGATGLAIPAIIASGAGMLVGGLHYAFLKFQQSSCEKNVQNTLAAKYQSEELVQGAERTGLPSVSGAPHAGLETAQLMEQQSFLLAQLERWMDFLIASVNHRSFILCKLTDVNLEKLDLMQFSEFSKPLPQNSDDFDILKYLEERLKMDRALSTYFRTSLEEQNQLIESLLEKSAYLNGKVLQLQALLSRL